MRWLQDSVEVESGYSSQKGTVRRGTYKPRLTLRRGSDGDKVSLIDPEAGDTSPEAMVIGRLCSDEANDNLRGNIAW